MSAVDSFGSKSTLTVGGTDYEVFRISSSQAKLSGDCQDDPDHTSNLRDGATFILYATSGDTDDIYYLDTGGDSVLTGELGDDGSYSFSGKVTDIQDTGDDAKITTITTVTISLVVDGNECSGTQTAALASSCAGAGCDFFTPSACSLTSTFTGVLLEDTDVSADSDAST